MLKVLRFCKAQSVCSLIRLLAGLEGQTVKVCLFTNGKNPFVLLTRVNSTNVLDEGLRIRGRGRRMNSKVKVGQTRRDYVCIENKRGNQLAQSQSVPGRPLLAPIYRWPGLKDPVGFNTNYNVRI
jgi:hypothetical protein